MESREPAPSFSQLKHRCAQLAALMDGLRAEVQGKYADEPECAEIEELRKIVKLSVCQFAKLMVPKIHQEIDEIRKRPELEKKLEKKLGGKVQLVVTSTGNGADYLVTHTDARGTVTTGALETKTSTCKVSKKDIGRSNLNWSIPAKCAETEGANRKELLDSVIEKTKPFGAWFDIVDGSSNPLAEYFLSHEFLMELFKRIKITKKTKSYNFGCARCSKKSCKSFHRLDRYKEYDEKFTRNGNRLADEDWKKLIDEDVPSTCK